MKKIKLIIFDLSNVCFSMEEPSFIHDFCLNHDVNEKKFDEEYQELVKKAEIGEISGIKIWEIMLLKYSIKEDAKALIKKMIGQKYEYKEVLEIVKELKDKGFITAYLSNYSKDYWDPIAEKWDMNEYFSSGLISYQIGARKPDKKGFLELINRYNVKPEETIFIDDFQGNIKQAENLGINIHQFLNYKELKEFFKKEELL